MTKFYIYLVTAPAYEEQRVVKGGITTDLYGRRSTYRTGCPPGFTPSYDIEYYYIWETDATSFEDLEDYETKLFNRFLPFRLMRNKPGDCEWFQFPEGLNPLKEMSAFIDSLEGMRKVPLDEVKSLPKKKAHMQKNYYKNTDFIRTEQKRLEVLNEIQAPVIEAITQFVASDINAGYVIAPCGSGKTLMTVRGIKGKTKLVICCPSLQIQIQWRNTILKENCCPADKIYFVGGQGTTDEETIKTICASSQYCLITTYMSSHLLIDAIRPDTQLLILDEAHHMAGVVTDEGQGRTRRLFMKATELSIKRLSLTYTPRFVDETSTDLKIVSMDDETLFGKSIAELKIRTLIKAGVLPDYRLWTLRDEGADGILAKGTALLEAWNATEIVRSEEKHILHHLIVFAATIADTEQLEVLFKDRLKDDSTVVLRVEGGDNLKPIIEQFTAAKRAILINCQVLNEGVDIPVANAVAITYPKQARGQITQMVLRAGRWYPGKPLFHVLLPMGSTDEDLSGLEYVLTALASCDDQISDEIIARAAPKPTEIEIGPDAVNEIVTASDYMPESIIIDEFEANADIIKRCFENIRKKLFISMDSRRIQKFCIEKGIKTSVQYNNRRSKEFPDLPEDPKPKAMTWYDYLNPRNAIDLNIEAFIRTIIEPNSLRTADKYEEWLQKTKSSTLPSLQNISDGYFGESYTNYNLIAARSLNVTSRRR